MSAQRTESVTSIDYNSARNKNKPESPNTHKNFFKIAKTDRVIQSSLGAERGKISERSKSTCTLRDSLSSQPTIALGPVGMNHLQHQLQLQRQQQITNSQGAIVSTSSSHNNNTHGTSTIDSNPNNPASFNRSNDAASVLAMNTNSNANYLYHPQHHQLMLQQQGRNPSIITDGQTYAGTSTNNSANGDNDSPWLQHMIINQINPLSNNLISINANANANAIANTTIARDNGSSEVRSNQGNAQSNDNNHQQFANQQQVVTEHSYGATDILQYHQQQGSTTIVGGTTTGASTIAAAEHMQQLEHMFLPSQQSQQQPSGSTQGQQQQNFQQHNQEGVMHLTEYQQQMLAVNGLASSQIQLPRTVQKEQHQPQQQSAVATSSIGNCQTVESALPTTKSSPLGLGLSTMSSLRQEQQQLLLLAFALQQQLNNKNSGAADVDLNALSATLATPEGIRLLNSFAIGQPPAPPQQQQLLSTQPQNHQHQYQHNMLAAAPTTHLAVDRLAPVATTATSGPQKDTLSNGQHSLFLSPQSQQQPQLLQPTSSLPLLMSMTQSPTMMEQHTETGKAGGGSTGIISDAANVAAVALYQHLATHTAPTSQTSNSAVLIASTNPSASSSSRISDIVESVLAATTMSTQAGSGKTVDRNFQHLPKRKDTGSSIGNTISRRSSADVSSCHKSSANTKFPRILYAESDDGILGEYQTLLRHQLELFEADSQDVINGTFRQGRTTPIKLGQIGLRCRHCALSPFSIRTKGSVYFSQTIKGMYQIAQNMSKVHLCERCSRVPEDTKKRMIFLRSRKNRASGGRAYWIRHLRELGVYEEGNALWAYPPGAERRKKPPFVTTTINASPSASCNRDSGSRLTG